MIIIRPGESDSPEFATECGHHMCQHWVEAVQSPVYLPLFS